MGGNSEQYETASALEKKHLVSSLLSCSVSAYEWSKAFTVAQLPILEKPLDFAQNQVVSLATGAFSHGKVNPEAVVSNLDSKALDLLLYFDVEQRYSLVKSKTAKPVKLIADAKDGACVCVSGLQIQASNRLDKMLGGAEEIVDSYLPSIGAENSFQADETKLSRLKSLPLFTSRRLRKHAMEKFSELRLQETKLSRYAEFLDLEAVRERVSSSAVGSKVLNSSSYATVKGFVVTKALPYAEANVFTPAKDFYAIATAEFIKLSESTKDFSKNSKGAVLARRLAAEEFAGKYIVMVKAACGEAWSEKLAKPTESFLGFCNTAYLQVQKACPEGQAQRVEALVMALRARLASEWETRVMPTITKKKAQ